MTPLVLLTGFLGSGKTSLLRQLLPLLVDAGLRPHVVLNDYANADLDSATLREIVEDVRPLTGSCICCDAREALFETLAGIELGDRDVVLLESSGTTDPLPLIEGLLVRAEGQRFGHLMQVGLVDAKRWQRRHHNNQLERMQVRTATHLVFTWQDAVSPTRLQAVRVAVARCNPRARVTDAATLATELARRIEREDEDAPPSFVRWSPLPPRKNFAVLKPLVAGAQPDRSAGSFLLPSLPGTHGCAHGAACDLHELAHRFTALQLEVPRRLPRERLLGWLDALPPAVLRAKGVVEFAEEPDSYHFFQRVEETASFTELPITPPGGRTLALLVGVGLNADALRRQAEEHFSV